MIFDQYSRAVVLLASLACLPLSSLAATPCCDVFASGKQKGFSPGSTKQYNAVYVRVRNTTASPAMFDPTSFTLVTPEGRALAVISPRLAAERMVNRVERWTDGLFGESRRDERARQNSSQGLLLKIEQEAAPVGPVPPGLYVEGLIFFEAAGKKLKSAELRMSGFDETPIPIRW